MNPLTILWLWSLGGALLLVGAMSAGYLGWRAHERGVGAAPYIQMIKDNNYAAVAKLKEETAKSDAATKALKEFSTRQEGIDHANTQTIVSLNSKLRSTRLRDPGKAGGCSGGATGANPASAGPGAASASAGSGLLSESASDFLWDFTLSADRINEAYRSCRAYAQSVRESLICRD